MKLRFDIPDDVGKLVEAASGCEPVLFFTPVDLDARGMFAIGWVAVTRSRFLTVGDSGIIENIAIKDGTDYKSCGMVGNGTLEAVINGTQRIIARYTMKHVPRYALIARALNNMSQGREPSVRSDGEENACPKCGRAFLEGSVVCPNCTNKIAALKRLAEIVKPHKLLILAAFTFFWLITGISIASPYIYRLFIDKCLLVPRSDPKTALAPILFYVSLLAASNIGNTALIAVRGRMMVRLGSRISMQLRDMVYAKLQTLSLSYLDKRKTGDLMNRVTEDTGRIRNFIQNQAVFGINQILIMTGICIILFASSWKLALVVLLPVPLLLVFVRATWRKFFFMIHKQWKTMDKANSLLQDILSGMRIVKSFGQEDREVGRFRDACRVVADQTGYNEAYFNTIFPLMSFLLGTGQFFVMYLGSKLVLGHNMAVGELVQFIQYVSMLYGPLGFMSFLPRMFADAMTALERVFEIMDVDPEVKDEADAARHDIKGAVSLKDVTFGYASHEPVLENMHVDIAPGEMLGLVGHSGAGKSTFINLVMRLYDVDEGQLLIDGIDIRNIPQQDLRSQIGVVLQDSFLFSGSILDNIRYSKQDASVEEVIIAAKIANAHDFIIRFTDGYDTKVGENGQNLSGGERQRIALARAILCDPKILILDEATASLDIEAEQQIQEALGRLVKNRTTIAIAHRLSTLRHAHRLLVIDKGKRAELGTHDELLKAKGIYYDLVMAQRQMTRVKKPEKDNL